MRWFDLDAQDQTEFWDAKALIREDTGPPRTTSRTGEMRHDFYPDAALATLSLDMRFEPRGAEPLLIEIPPYLICLDGHPYGNAGSHIGFPPHYSAIARTEYQDVQAAGRLVLRRGRPNRVHLDCAEGRVEVRLNEKDRMSYRTRYQPTFSQIRIVWPSDTTVTGLVFEGEPATRYTKPVPAQAFSLQMAIDFNGDITPAPYTREMYESVIERLARIGFTRLYWVDHGGLRSGFWDPTGSHFLNDDHVARTFASLGDDPLKLTVDLAHTFGMEAYAVIKPFDLAPHGHSFAPGSEPAEKYGKCDVLGGRAFGCMDFYARNTRLCMQRRPYRAVEGPVTRIVLTQRDPGPPSIRGIEIWESDDNWKYRRHRGAPVVHRAPGQMVLENLSIRSPFFALVPVPPGTGQTFANVPGALVRLYNGKGEEIPFTYGLKPRIYAEFITGKSEHLQSSGYRIRDFRDEGFSFDQADHGVPGSVMSGDSTQNRWYSLDNVYGALGIALGKSPFTPGVFSPSEPEARQYWLGWVENAVRAGVDGVDLRRMHHCHILEWRQYGFNDIPCAEFKRRHGVDPRTQDFDMEAWRRLRGEYYTQLLREARDLLHRHGKKLQVHVEDQMEGEPDASTMQEIHWNWREWIDGGIADEVTLKALNTDTYRSHFGREVIRTCRAKGLPVYYCPFVHTYGVLGRPDWREYFSTGVPQSGADGVVIYEMASVIRSDPEGGLHDTHPDFFPFLTHWGQPRN